MRNPSTTSTKKTTTPTPCCSKVGIKRGPWTPEEDELLASYIRKEGEGRWRTLPKRAGLLRCGKSCRLRWMNYLRPSVKRGRIAPDEEDLILRLHRLLGNRWSLIAGRIPGRTDNEIKNYWNTHLSKKLISQGIDPRTHKPLLNNPNPNNTSGDDADHHGLPKHNSNPSSSHLDETGRTYRVIATKVSENFTMAHLDHDDDQYQNHVANNNHNLDGTETWPNCDGFLMGFQGEVMHHGQSNADDYNIIGNHEDTFSSFLDSLISDHHHQQHQSAFANHHHQQPSMNNNNLIIRPSFDDHPIVSPAAHQPFNQTSLWEAEAVLSSMGALGDEDGTALNRHLA